MKTSNKLVLAVAILIVLVLTFSVVGVRLYTDTLLTEAGGSVEKGAVSGSKEIVEKTYDLSGFTRIEVEGGWRVHVEKEDAYSIRVSGPEAYLERLRVEKSGDELKIGAQAILQLDSARMTIHVEMPELEAMELSGGIQLDVKGFSGESLELIGRGGTSVEASGGRYARLDLDFSGGTDLDLRELPAERIDIRSSGALDAEVTVIGGKLTGKLSGAGELRYYGSVVEKNVVTEGVTNVTRAD